MLPRRDRFGAPQVAEQGLQSHGAGYDSGGGGVVNIGGGVYIYRVSSQEPFKGLKRTRVLVTWPLVTAQFISTSRAGSFCLGCLACTIELRRKARCFKPIRKNF